MDDNLSVSILSINRLWIRSFTYYY